MLLAQRRPAPRIDECPLLKIADVSASGFVCRSDEIVRPKLASKHWIKVKNRAHPGMARVLAD